MIGYNNKLYLNSVSGHITGILLHLYDGTSAANFQREMV